MDEIDLDILEAAYYGEPWHVLCGMVVEHFSDIRSIVPRIFRLQSQGLLDIEKDTGTKTNPTKADLEQIAIKRSMYGTNQWPDSPTWSIKTTAQGFEYIKDRFK